MRPFQCEYGLPRVIDGDNSGRRRDYNSSGGRRSSDRQRSNVASTQSSCEWNSADRRVKVSCSRFNDAASSDDKPSIHGSEFSESFYLKPKLQHFRPKENSGWGYDRIVGAVANVLALPACCRSVFSHTRGSEPPLAERSHEACANRCTDTRGDKPVRTIVR